MYRMSFAVQAFVLLNILDIGHAIIFDPSCASTISLASQQSERCIDRKQSTRNRFLRKLLRMPSFQLPMVQLS